MNLKSIIWFGTFYFGNTQHPGMQIHLRLPHISGRFIILLALLLTMQDFDET